LWRHFVGRRESRVAVALEISAEGGGSPAHHQQTETAMNQRTKSDSSKVRQANIVRVNGSMTMYLPFGLGVVFGQHWTDDRTTIHAQSNCRHCQGKRIEIRDVTAHVGMVRVQSSWERQIVILPPRASQELIDACDQKRFRNQPLRINLRRATKSPRSPIILNVSAYTPAEGYGLTHETIRECLIQVLWERMYGTDWDDDSELAKRSITKLV